ncbi:DUF4183 domain-containing protein [Priestia endophytica]|uniref:DUF4183 domain-containing protein n=1 Tax=Priestia endophytica DSM 13796 TaxID=1121089 RepID=A0A1I6B340_9BACI|nr:DUF4183 domain-containing protein [Priestia endophytica]KYG26835.1 hypothetical protein AZF06_16010 [Priestia endophytica]SFQ75372.1 protein of unknown function [Priestia endophytica DSM 13796]
MPIIKPFMASRKFSATIGDGTGTGATFAIAATTFIDDTGATTTAFPASFAYYVLYINVQPQTADTATLTTITIPGGDVLDDATPILIEIVVN